jgi:ubiquinone biosynthesis protein
VHRAVLLSGKTVALKVQKPKIRDMIERDLDIMFFLAHLLNRLSMFKNYDALEIVKEFSAWTLRELDFNKEAASMEKFRYNLQDHACIIPKVYHEYTTEKLLVMEFESGEHLSEHTFRSEHERKAFVENLASIICRMVFEDGLFHADLHRGNVFITRGGKLILLDFGMVGTLSEQLRGMVSEIFISLIDKDTEGAVDLLLKMTEQREGAQLASYRAFASKTIEDWYDKPISKCSIIMTFYELVAEGAKKGIVYPADLVLLAKSLMNFEGVAIEISPDASVENIIRPYIEKIVLQKYSPVTVAGKFIRTVKKNRDLYANLPDHIAELIRMVEAGEVRFHLDPDELSRFEGAVERSTDKEALAIIITALLVTSPLLYSLEKEVIGLNLGIISVFISLALLFRLLYLMGRNNKGKEHLV